jgi:hypothetical protein
MHSVKFAVPLSTYWFSNVDLEALLILTITSSLREYPLGAQGSGSVPFLEEPANEGGELEEILRLVISA